MLERNKILKFYICYQKQEGQKTIFFFLSFPDELQNRKIFSVIKVNQEKVILK
jgi:hypothetical protein